MKVQWRLAIGILSQCAVIAMGTEPTEDVYLGVDYKVVFDRISVECEGVEFGAWQSQSTCGGAITYYCGAPVTARIGTDERVIGYSDHVSMAVYPSTSQAKQDIDYRRRVLAAPHPVPSSEEMIGNDLAWGLPQREAVGGSIVFRRRNVVISVCEKSGRGAEITALARRIDALIRDDRKIAPLGRFDPAPAIADAGIPKVLRVRKARQVDAEGKVLTRGRALPWACVRIEPRFEGLGSVEQIAFKVTSEPPLIGNQVALTGFSIPKSIRVPESIYVPAGEGLVRTAEPCAENDGRFIVRVRVPDERTVCKVKLVACNRMNVIVTKELQVVVEPQH